MCRYEQVRVHIEATLIFEQHQIPLNKMNVISDGES